jgi:5'-deoxynucleotidase YfbR-like HD superfamily hydrolase
LLKSAIVHDLGENSVGDLTSPVKWENPDLYAALEADALATMGFDVSSLVLADREAAVLHLCDGLDAYLWAAFQNPAFVQSRLDWLAMFGRLQARAADLGLTEKLNKTVEGICNGKF